LAPIRNRGNLARRESGGTTTSGLALGGLGVAATKAVALDGDDAGVMDDAVDERGGAGGVGEDRGLLAEGQVRGEDEALLLVAAADDLALRLSKER
jgi:hypothetical protein